MPSESKVKKVQIRYSIHDTQLYGITLIDEKNLVLLEVGNTHPEGMWSATKVQEIELS